MNERQSEAKDFSPLDSRANLFYFLRITSGLVASCGRKAVVDSALSDRPIEVGQKPNRLAL